MKKYFTITIYSILIVSGSVYSQSAFEDVNITPPNAAALGKFVDLPVNTHTGVPNISIPITMITEGPLSLPLWTNF